MVDRLHLPFTVVEGTKHAQNKIFRPSIVPSTNAIPNRLMSLSETAMSLVPSDRICLIGSMDHISVMLRLGI